MMGFGRAEEEQERREEKTAGSRLDRFLFWSAGKDRERSPSDRDPWRR